MLFLRCFAVPFHGSRHLPIVLFRGASSPSRSTLHNTFTFHDLCHPIKNVPLRSVEHLNSLRSFHELQQRKEATTRDEAFFASAKFKVDVSNFVSLLKDCTRKKNLVEGSRLYAVIRKRKGLVENNPSIASALIRMYAKCGVLAKAQQILEDLPNQNVVSWNILIAGYAQRRRPHEALSCFVQMQVRGLVPDAVTFIFILKSCGNIGAIDEGERILETITKRGLLEKDVVLGTAVVDMYVKCGVLKKAHEVLDSLFTRDVVCWNALISGYAHQGKGYEALRCFEWMQNEGLSPDKVTFICMLKACGNIRDIETGAHIHKQILSRDMLTEDVVLGNALVDMYVKCSMLTTATKVLRGLPNRNTASWNTIISGYIQHGKDAEAVNCFEGMQHEGISSDVVTFICTLKACASANAIEKGKEIHRIIVHNGFLEKDIAIGNALVDMYCKCGEPMKAQEVLEELPLRNVVSWSCLIIGYTCNGQGHEALDCYEQMQKEGISPDAVTYTGILKACGILKAMKKGEQLHESIISKGLLENDCMLSCCLVDMYIECGVLAKAREVLDLQYIRNVFCWAKLISGYTEEGQGHEALDCFGKMQNEGIAPNEVIYACILKACGNMNDMENGRRIHQMIMMRGLLEKDIVLGTALVDMYAKCSALLEAQKVFDNLSVRTVVTWNALIYGYVKQDQCMEVWSSFKKMQKERVSPDAITLICTLKVCGRTRDAGKGKEIHEEIVNRGLLQGNIILGNALVDMYVKCGALIKAWNMLEALSVRNEASWNTLIAGYVHHEAAYEALHCVELMQSEGLFPDEVTFTCILKACTSMGDLAKGCQIHEQILDKHLHMKDAMIGNALVDMYAKCGAFAKAQKVLEELPFQDVIAWNSLISGYDQHGQCYEVLDIFYKMQRKGLHPDVVTLLCVLSACGDAGAIDKGKRIHDEIVCRGLLENDIMLGNALVDMYVKCGAVAKAFTMLEELAVRDRTSWNALIAGYAEQGQGHKSLDCFSCMQLEGICPDEVTFLCVLNACCQSGLLVEAQMLFQSMTREYRVAQKLEHHVCMVVSFACAGYFDEAISVIKAMPSSNHPEIWLVLLSACKKWGNVKLGKLAFDQMIQLDDGLSSAYILMASTFGAAGLQEDAMRVEMMKSKYSSKERPEYDEWASINETFIVLRDNDVTMSMQ